MKKRVCKRNSLKKILYKTRISIMKNTYEICILILKI